jgi:hypothetical protein
MECPELTRNFARGIEEKLYAFYTMSLGSRPPLWSSGQFLATDPDAIQFNTQQTPWPNSASKLYRPSDCRMSAKLVPTFADRGCCMVRTTDPYSRILGYLDRRRYFLFQVAPQLHS